MHLVLSASLPSREVVEQVEIQIKYEGYLSAQEAQAARLQELEAIRIPRNFVYREIGGLSAEVIEKLTKIQPTTLGFAARISGITPAALSILAVSLSRAKRRRSMDNRTNEPVPSSDF